MPGGGPEAVAITVIDDVVAELRDGFLLLVYDLPTEDRAKTFMRRSDDPDVEFLARRVKNWYDWSVSRLRSLGYPLQLSVVLLPKDQLDRAREVIADIRKRWELVLKSDRWGLYSGVQPDVKIVRLRPEGEEDARALMSMARETLKAMLLDLRESLMRKLREEKTDPAKLYTRTKKALERIRAMDGFGFLERDEELRRILYSIEMLLA